jgi:drug/metabolite transporter (DMT)-like permease
MPRTGPESQRDTDRRSPAAGVHANLKSAPVFALVILLVAADSVAERFLNQQLPPYWLAGTRFASAGLLYAALVAVLHLRWPRGRDLVAAVLFGLLQFALGYALLYYALQTLPASLASMVLASVPLFTLLLASAGGQERIRLRSVLGALIALAGIALLVGTHASGPVGLPQVLAVLGTALCFSLAAVILKSAPPPVPASTNAVGMLIGAPILLGLAWITGETANGFASLLPTTSTAWWAQIYLILPGTLGVYSLMLFLLRRWPASTVSYQSVLIPLVATLLSVWLLGEAITGSFFAGAALVLAGVYLGALYRRRPE